MFFGLAALRRASAVVSRISLHQPGVTGRNTAARRRGQFGRGRIVSVDVFPRAWSVIPPISAGANTGHPLCPRFGFVCNGAIVDLVRGVRGVSVGSTPGKFSTGSVRGYSGSVREHTATTDLDYLGPTKLIWPTQEVTVLLGYEKTDGVNRISA